MLDINPDTVRRLIALAKEFHAQEQVVIPESSTEPSGDWAAQILASHQDDLTFQEFKSIVNDLSPEQQQQIVALLWVGRDDFSVDQWSEALEEAAYSWSTNTPEYLIAHPLLADYWEFGLTEHGYDTD